MSCRAMEQELANSLLWAVCHANSVGRQTAVRFGFPGTIGFGRCRTTDRDSTRYCRVGAPRPRSAAAVGLPMGNSSCSCHEAPLTIATTFSPRASYGFLMSVAGCSGGRPPSGPIDFRPNPLEYPDSQQGRDKDIAHGVILRGELGRYDSQSSRLQPYLGGISAEFVISSPDGQFVAYVTFPEGILWRANRDGSHPVQLTDHSLYPLNLISLEPAGRLTALRYCSAARARRGA
jgi:hypothetical protein